MQTRVKEVDQLVLVWNLYLLGTTD